jgi:signal-transduction protein with cAMP-binding, CBS, and nucleotidyltransferase domain
VQFIRLQKSLAVTRTMHLVVTHLNDSTGQRIPVRIITERDIIFIVVAQNGGPFNITLKDMMSTPIINIDVGKSVEGAAAILNKYKINRLPAVHDSSIIGILITGII